MFLSWTNVALETKITRMEDSAAIAKPSLEFIRHHTNFGD